MSQRDLAHYRQLPYERALEIRTEGTSVYYLYRVVEMPAIAGDGDSKAEALQNLHDAFDDYISWRLEDGLDIPQPARHPVYDERGTETCKVALTRPAAVAPRVETAEPGWSTALERRDESLLGSCALAAR